MAGSPVMLPAMRRGQLSAPAKGMFAFAAVLLAALGIALESVPSARAVAPALPIHCQATTSSFSNPAPKGIPPIGKIESTIDVAGAGPFLRDADLVTNIVHSFPFDLDIQLISPAGTVVTITTDNGGTAKDAFNGTVWDDDADPADGGPVTDHVYTSEVVASPLVPEEAMAAFVGENPNGTWTLIVVDDRSPDGGSLSSWQLNLQTLPAGPPAARFESSLEPLTPIPDASTTGVSSPMTLVGLGTSIGDVNLFTRVPHQFSADLEIRLTSPAGTVATITTRNGGASDDVFKGTLWDDGADPADTGHVATDHTYPSLVVASPLVPEEAMGAFIGEDPNGTWTLHVADEVGADLGTLESWALFGNTVACPPPPPPPPPPSSPSALPTLTVGNATVKEGDGKAKMAKLSVKLSGAAGGPVAVAFATKKGSAKPGSDFKAKSGKLVFAPGQTVKTIVVKVVGDRKEERKEKFEVRLSSPSGATIADAGGVVTIKKND